MPYLSSMQRAAAHSIAGLKRRQGKGKGKGKGASWDPYNPPKQPRQALHQHAVRAIAYIIIVIRTNDGMISEPRELRAALAKKS